jgi:tellurite resistance protein TerC
LSVVHPFRKFFHRVGLDLIPPIIRRTIIALIGGTIVLIGLLLIFLPGPGALVILVGLAVLGTEFVWAKRLIRRARELGKQGTDYVKSLVAKP